MYLCLTELFEIELFRYLIKLFWYLAVCINKNYTYSKLNCLKFNLALNDSKGAGCSKLIRGCVQLRSYDICSDFNAKLQNILDKIRIINRRDWLHEQLLIFHKTLFMPEPESGHRSIVKWDWSTSSDGKIPVLECRLTFYCHYPQFHFDPNRKYLLGSHQWRW